YILLNFAIGANFIPPPDSTTVFPAYVDTDYVRVWKPAGQGTPSPSQGITATPIPTSTPSVTHTPSPTISSGSTSFSLTICPHGLGHCGDNVNANGGGNTTPQHLTKTITL